MPPLLTICFISESAMPVAPVLPCEAEAAVPLWPDLDWVFVVFGETGRWRQPGYVTDLNFGGKTNKIQVMIKAILYLTLFLIIKSGIYVGEINLVTLLKDVSANEPINM